MFVLRVSSNSGSSDDGKRIGEIVVEGKGDKVVDFKNQVARLQATVASLPPVVFVMKRQPGSNFAIAFCILATILFISVRVHMAKKARHSRPGSVADLVRRGQLRSDRRGISTPLKYEDPFNNPLVKVGKSDSTVEMCGKVYRLAPVTLTREQQAIHQKRRSRAYQWKRPTVFLREGDPVPPDVDPDTIRWIPANHPFATTASDIDEDLAQNNVYQKHGVPFRIQAEHEALQRKLEALQSVENVGPDPVLEVLLPFPDHQAKNLAYLAAATNEGKGKSKGPATSLPIEVVQPNEMPPALIWYSVSLPKGLGKGESLTLDVLAVFTHALRPFPEKISQAENQLVAFQESVHYLSPYIVKPFAVAQELLREIEISHWGNVQLTEHYNLIHGGSQIKGEFSRLDYQARPHVGGASAFRNLVANLPPRAHSVYYRDEIGNISTSNLWGDSKKTQLEIEPRYPMFGGWRTSFTIGYGLPLKYFLFQSEGKRFLNISFGSPIRDLVIDNLIVKTKFSHLDIDGRPVVVLEKTNVVQEHSQYFQVYYKFAEGAVDVNFWIFLHVYCLHCICACGFYNLKVFCFLCGKTAMGRVHDRLDATLRDLSRTGDVHACKVARKAADSLLKDLSKELKPLLAFLHSSPQAAQILPKVEDLIAKEHELQEKLMLKHSAVVEGYEKKSGGREMENRVALIQQKLTALRQEVDDLLEVIDEI
ncbi:hypothetical protein RHGRI_015744 [Rhododendron griersonianum]|nr:hypothetical protein RHGRI_015744 [Rhododendron griersonianum]